jgi:4-amino-4-deoxy-L-arabinose transferase-like glycosyltransferase
MKFLIWVLVVIYFTLLIFLTQHTGWIEMVVYPYLLNHGFTYYKDLIMPYPPLLLWVLQSVEKVFGYSPMVLIVLSLLLGLLNTWLIYFFSLKIWKSNKLALSSVFIYSLWFFFFEGNGLWFELFQTPFILAAFYFLYDYFFMSEKEQVKKLFLAGLFLGIAFFIKQNVVWLMILSFGLCLIYKRANLIKVVTWLALPFLGLLVLTSAVAYLGGYLNEYWQWAFNYSFLYFPTSPGHNAYPTLADLSRVAIVLVCLLPMLFGKFSFKKLFLLLFLLGAFMSALPRWGLFHLQPFLAVLALVTPEYIGQWLGKKPVIKGVLVVGVLLIWIAIVTRQDLRMFNKPIRFFEPQIYSQAMQISNLGTDSIYILNGSDQIYPISGTVPKVKPYVQNFAWYLEYDGLQDQVISSLQSVKPKLIIVSPFQEPAGFGIGHYRPQKILEYVNQNYQVKGLIDSNVVWEKK